MSNLLNTFMVYQFVRQLVTPFTQMPAYELGLIDDKGDFKRDPVTPQEMDAASSFNILVINLKRLLGRLPGGNSRLASFAAALYLLKKHKTVNESNLQKELNSMVIEFELCRKEADIMITEDGVAVNATGPAVSGTGPGDPTIVNSYSRKKYKNANAKGEKGLGSFSGMIARRKNPVSEDTTLEYHQDLNPKIWTNDHKLKPEVRGKLLQIAEAWRMFAKIPLNKVQGIILTGGNANYNYTPMSDLDVHLVVDRNSFNVDRELVDEYLQDKKTLWTMTHNDISIYGYPVELYAQDVTEVPHYGQGVYDIQEDQWIQAPEKLNIDFTKDPLLQSKVDDYKDLIDKLIADKADKDSIEVVKKKIRNMRGAAIQKGGEFSFENLVFKDLRNQGYLDKLSDYEKTMMDKALSL
jgi:hypothetical protein